MSSYKPSRLFLTGLQRKFNPTITNTPALPAIDFAKVGQTPPRLIAGAGQTLPIADVVVITWADAEWAAMQHVFCAGASPMPYSARNTGSWSGWTRYATGLPANPPSGWTFWGEWRLVEIGSATVML
jgi:hypothetical protein